MSWQDEARANGYVQAALNANNDRELERGMQAADKGVELAEGIVNGVGNVVKGIFSGPEPPPPKSSGGGLGGLLVLGALAGGAYLLSKAFGGSDDKKDTQSRSVSQDLKSAEEYLSRGNNYYSQRKYELAIKDYSNAIRLNPKYAAAYYNRSNAYNALGGNTENAKADYNRAKQLGYFG